MKETPIFEEVFTRVLKLPGFWIKILIGGLLSFVPIVNLLAFGYLFRVSGAVRNSGELSMPEWDDWKNLFIDGLKFAVVWLAYWLLPLLLAGAISSVIGTVGLGAVSYVLLSISFFLTPILFSSALYRYTTRGDFKVLLDVALIVRMSYMQFPRMLIPALVIGGIFAICGPLYGFAFFFSFVILVSYTALTLRSLEQSHAVAL